MLFNRAHLHIIRIYEDLAYIKLTHYGFDENMHYGEMVVDKRLAEDVVEIFKELYDKKYPIEKVLNRPENDYEIKNNFIQNVIKKSLSDFADDGALNEQGEFVYIKNESPLPKTKQ